MQNIYRASFILIFFFLNNNINSLNLEPGEINLVEINLKDQEINLVRESPEACWAYMEPEIRDILQLDLSIAEFDTIKDLVNDILVNPDQYNSLSKEQINSLQEYRKDLESGDALLILDPNQKRKNKKVSVVCNLLVNKKIKADNIYSNSLNTKQMFAKSGTIANLVTSGQVSISETGSITAKNICVADGSAEAPGYSFCNNQNNIRNNSTKNNGIYLDTAGNLAFAVNGINQITIEPNKIDISSGIIEAGKSKTGSKNLVISPRGSGSLQASLSGNSRGQYAVDLQLSTINPDQVAGGDYSAIINGQNNEINQGTDHAFIGAGSNNIIYPGNGSKEALASPEILFFLNPAKIPANLEEIASTYNSSLIAGGDHNTIGTGADHSFIGGGEYNSINQGSFGSLIVAGGFNTINSDTLGAMIVGGAFNNIEQGALGSVILGGAQNNINAGSLGSVITGGGENSILYNAQGAVIGGGIKNIVGNNAFGAIINGGEYNVINSTGGIITGGGFNTIQPNCYGAIINGGEYNLMGAGSNFSLIAGEQNSILSANHSVIPGGYNNKINTGSANSFAAGSTAIVQESQPGSFVWSDGNYGTGAISNGPATFNIYSTGGIYLFSSDLKTGDVSINNGLLQAKGSSKKYKKEIESLSKDESTKIYNLEPVKFLYNSQDNREEKSYGLIAEDVEKEYKELIYYNNNGQPDSVKYYALPVLILNELKKLKTQVEQLELEIKNK